MEERARIVKAKGICARCPVKADCLEESIRMSCTGIWGGLDTRERLGRGAVR